MKFVYYQLFTPVCSYRAGSCPHGDGSLLSGLTFNSVTSGLSLSSDVD